MINIDVRSSIEDIRRALDTTRENVIDKATVAALNRAGVTMQNEGAHEVQKVYTTLKITKLKGYFRLERASRGRLNVKINPKGGRIPLTFFSAVEWKAKGGGVSVDLGSEKIFIPHAFIRRRGARTAVFMRAPDYQGQLYHKGTFRPQRVARSGNDLPIAELFARSVPEVILRHGIDKTLVLIGEERFSVEFERQLKFYLIQFEANL